MFSFESSFVVQQVKDLVSPVVVWVQSLAWEFPYAMGVAIKKKKKANFLKFGVPAVAHRK